MSFKNWIIAELKKIIYEKDEENKKLKTEIRGYQLQVIDLQREIDLYKSFPSDNTENVSPYISRVGSYPYCYEDDSSDSSEEYY